MKTRAGVSKVVGLAIALAFFSACDHSKEEQAAKLAQEQTEALKASKESESRISAERDSLKSEMVATLDEIGKRLDIIRDQKGMLVLGANSNINDGQISRKDHIMNNIAMMDELLSDNAKKIKSLQYRIGKISKGTKELEEQLAVYQLKNSAMEAELSGIKEQLLAERSKNEELSKRISDKEVAYSDLQQRYTKVEDDAYSVYYVAGSRSQLKAMKVTEKNNTVFNVGLGRHVSAAPDYGKFQKTDMRTVSVIPVKAKKAQILTDHAENSYAWEDAGDGSKNLKIIDPSTFWKGSKFLVIETK
jgi:hypothetical protein